ncbi:hypothetical protein GGD66_000755 [Bradyrhizobium sp. CIR48]|nr:hypothetical protein [Bradyrhizobium sp. CIR3A]MBB4422229.1 hypothetical protein [Bradyrhizobium sp. CIR48]
MTNAGLGQELSRDRSVMLSFRKKHASLSNSIGIANADGATKRHHASPILREKILAQ